MGSFFQSLRSLLTNPKRKNTGSGIESFSHFNQQVKQNVNARIVEIISGCCEAIRKCCDMKYGMCSSSCLSISCCPK